MPEPSTPFVDRPLVEVCPSELVIQLEGLPSVEHGPLYRLIVADPVVDNLGRTVSGPIVRADGAVEDVVLTLRSGGPVVAFREPLSLMVDDPSITMGVGSTADLVAGHAALPAVSVVSLTERSHDVVVWDPVTYPQAVDIPTLAADGVELHHAPGEPFIEFLSTRGALDGARLVDSYLGEPAAFVAAGGAIAQQGDELVDPLLFATLPQWNRVVGTGAAADEGWASYDDTVFVRASAYEELAGCLDIFVPVIQDAIVAHVTEPSVANAVIADVRLRLNPLTRTSLESLDQGVATGIESGVVGGGPDGAVGRVDPDRMAAFVPELVAALDLPAVDPAEIATDAHIQPDRTL